MPLRPSEFSHVKVAVGSRWACLQLQRLIPTRGELEKSLEYCHKPFGFQCSKQLELDPDTVLELQQMTRDYPIYDADSKINIIRDLRLAFQ